RDPARIAHVARDIAGLTQIDHCIITHWHRDHVGGLPPLSRLIPVKHYYDHGLPSTAAADVEPDLLEAYRQTVGGASVTLKPGDLISIRPSPKYLPPLQVQVVAAGGIVLGEQSGAPQIKPCGPTFEPQPEDKTDNVNSVGVLLSFGRFKFFNGGDLTWNIEDRLACPKNLIGGVDVYQVDHHGVDSSNNPALVRALKPRVAIIDSGPRKGAEVKTLATLKSMKQIEAIYQLHRNVRTTEKDNAPADFTANDEEDCKGAFIKLSVDADGMSYSVEIPAKKVKRNYRTR
ncbi:MAG: MBL fold metallo-hydrolase, partial [Acidobacteriota bacterium]|nr:MBL fold metallo-hydrolase [Acidobacteriota bacterium]